MSTQNEWDVACSMAANGASILVVRPCDKGSIMLPFWRDGKPVILRAATEAFACSGVPLPCLKGGSKTPKRSPQLTQLLCGRFSSSPLQPKMIGGRPRAASANFARAQRHRSKISGGRSRGKARTMHHCIGTFSGGAGGGNPRQEWP